METKNKLGLHDVNTAAHEAKREIGRDAQAAKHELNEALHNLAATTNSKERLARAKEMVSEAKHEIDEEVMDARDSIDDIRDEYRSGKTKSARKTIDEIHDIVDEALLDIDAEV